MRLLNDFNLFKDMDALSRSIQNRHVSPLEVAKLMLDRIQEINPVLNAYITVSAEDVLADAAVLEKDLSSGNYRGPLHGVPIGLKDIIFTKGIRTTMGSAIYKNFVPAYDAAVVERLKQAGALIIGKLNTHEFAYGPTGDRSHYGPVKNPYDLSKISGGSSSGPGAGVASLLCFGAVGSDTGGSIRIPSSCCGIVGMKPTFGRVSKYGVFPLAHTLDHIGPMTKTVRDNAVLLNVLSGFDSRDPYSVAGPIEDLTEGLEQGIKGKTIGLPSTFYFDNLQDEVRNKVNEAIEIFEKSGAQIKIIEMKGLTDLSLAHQITIKCEAYSIHEKRIRTEGEKYDFEVKERLLGGENIKAYEYIQAQEIKQSWIERFNYAFKDVEVIVVPTLPVLPTNIEQREVEINGHKEPVRAALTRFTGPTNLTGFPSLSLSCGITDAGLPVGLQIIGKPFDEATVYQFAFALEREISLLV